MRAPPALPELSWGDNRLSPLVPSWVLDSSTGALWAGPRTPHEERARSEVLWGEQKSETKSEGAGMGVGGTAPKVILQMEGIKGGRRGPPVIEQGERGVCVSA